ncbi:hypothetical protein LZC95_49340 [Pendulispora brunnea]|uniref:Uncharacterized protein n=1 Tax=Pendulispora brunnea TaxID=2905690 RepID=A0ABZ2K6Y2_9BACT
MIIRDLSEESRALLDLAKDDGLPDDAQLERTRARLAEKIGTGMVLGAAAAMLGKTAAAPVATKAAGWSSSLAFKAFAMLALLGGGSAAVGGYMIRPHATEMSTLHAPTTAHALVAASTPPARPMPRVAVPESTAPPEIHVMAPAPRPRVDAPAVHHAAPPAPPTTAPDVAPIQAPLPRPAVARVSLMNDVAHLREAQRALTAGDPTRAREEAERVRDDGPLAEEGEGMRILAACAEPARKAESQVLVDGFTRRRPESPLLLRIRAACSPYSR